MSQNSTSWEQLLGTVLEGFPSSDPNPGSPNFEVPWHSILWYSEQAGKSSAHAHDAILAIRQRFAHALKRRRYNVIIHLMIIADTISKSCKPAQRHTVGSRKFVAMFLGAVSSTTLPHRVCDLLLCFLAHIVHVFRNDRLPVSLAAQQLVASGWTLPNPVLPARFIIPKALARKHFIVRLPSDLATMVQIEGRAVLWDSNGGVGSGDEKESAPAPKEKKVEKPPKKETPSPGVDPAVAATLPKPPQRLRSRRGRRWSLVGQPVLGTVETFTLPDSPTAVARASQDAGTAPSKLKNSMLGRVMPLKLPEQPHIEEVRDSVLNQVFTPRTKGMLDDLFA